MTHPLFDSIIADRRLQVVASQRSDGDVHPVRVPPFELRSRQREMNPPGRNWSMVDQVHGIDVIDADVVGGVTGRSGDNCDSWVPMLGIADVIVTCRLDVPIAIWAGDCAPIVLAADDGTLVGAHGGWRGLAAGVVDVAVATATRHGGAVVSAVLGPVIRPCCYEFSGENRMSIPDAVEGRTRSGRPALDVPATVAASLARHGVSVDATGACTGCDDRWFSHRVRADARRHATVAWWETAA